MPFHRFNTQNWKLLEQPTTHEIFSNKCKMFLLLQLMHPSVTSQLQLFVQFDAISMCFHLQTSKVIKGSYLTSELIEHIYVKFSNRSLRFKFLQQHDESCFNTAVGGLRF